MKKDIFIKTNDLIIFDDRHKLFCGDCTKIESYNFMENEIATMCFTSPPYNMGFGNYGNPTKCQAKKYIDKKGKKEHIKLCKIKQICKGE